VTNPLPDLERSEAICEGKTRTVFRRGRSGHPADAEPGK
jgi:hypothetical protein